MTWAWRLEGLQLPVAGRVAFMVGALSHRSEPTGLVGLSTREGRRVSLAARGPGCSLWARGTLHGVCPEGSGRHPAPLPQSWCVPEPQDKDRRPWGAFGLVVPRLS